MAGKRPLAVAVRMPIPAARARHGLPAVPRAVARVQPDDATAPHAAGAVMPIEMMAALPPIAQHRETVAPLLWPERGSPPDRER